MYFAAIDLGSNSFHMIVVKQVEQSIVVVQRVKEKVQLAKGLDGQNRLAPESIAHGLTCLAEFRDVLSAYNAPVSIKAVATATLRIASNPETFTNAASALLGNPIDIISGEQEAALIYRGVTRQLATRQNLLVFDIGGASTEVIIGRGKQPIHLTSIDIGCVTLTDRFFPEGRITQAAVEHATVFSKQQIQGHAHGFNCIDHDRCLGASGTPKTIIAVLQAQGHSPEIRLNRIDGLIAHCSRFPNLNEIELEGLAAHRKTVFLSGLIILQQLFSSFNVESLEKADGALREGIIEQWLSSDTTDPPSSTPAH